MSISRSVFPFVVVVLVATCSAAQDQKPTVKHVPAPATSAASGKGMFKEYCASCHGPAGKGNGPAAPALKVQPSDLTLLAKNNGGQYPSLKVMSVLNGQRDLAAHGSQEMPVWGPIFYLMSGGSKAQQQQRVANLTDYIGSLQAK
jgi:mono/diheme cytochrome c family protein